MLEKTIAGIFCVLVITATIATILSCWGLVFWGVDSLFPGIIVNNAPAALAAYGPFAIGVCVGIVVAVVRTVLAR